MFVFRCGCLPVFQPGGLCASGPSLRLQAGGMPIFFVG
jgi:hypothetical protein